MTQVAVGHQGLVGIGIEETAGLAVAPSLNFLFNSESMKRADDVLEDDGITGSRGRASIRRTKTLQKIAGGLRRDGISREHMPLLLQLVCGAWSGGSLSVGSATLAEGLPSATIRVYRGVEEFIYAGCKVGSLKLSSSESAQALVCELSNIIGMSGSQDVKSEYPDFPANERSLAHMDSTLRIGDAEMTPESQEVEIANTLEAKFYNSETATEIVETDRKVSGRVGLPWADDAEEAALARFYAGEAAEIVMAWEDQDGNGIEVTLPQCYFNGDEPQVGGRTQTISLGVPFDARDSVDGANDAIMIRLYEA